ncbi:hypothetical protein KXV85_005471, partial [Aspergillus fumigatus]
PVVEVSPAGQAVLLDLRRGVRAARLSRRPAAGRHLCRCRPGADGLLLRLLPDPAAAAEPDRDAAPGAELDCRRRAGEERQGRLDRGGVAGCRRPVHRRHAERPRRGPWYFAAGQQMVFRRTVRKVRSRRDAARPQGLQGSLLVLSRPVP